MLKIYGNKPSRIVRCLWALEELGLPYQQVAVPDSNAPAFLALNPAGKIPVLQDGDFVLTESVAINLYLASLTPSQLFPQDLKTRTKINQWSLWTVTEFEFPFTTMVREIRRATGAGQAPDAELVGTCLQTATETLAMLEAHFASGQVWVAGDAFTIGDINASFPVIALAPKLDMSGLPGVADWLARCTAREAWKRVQAIDESDLASI